MELSDKNSINPDIWGPYFWNVIHLTSFGYPSKPNTLDKQTYRNFYLNLGKILPCDSCSNSCIEFMEKSENHENGCDLNIDHALESRESLIKWGFDFHNVVNEKLGKKYPKTFESFNENYISNLENAKDKCRRMEYAVMFLILIIIILAGLLITRIN